MTAIQTPLPVARDQVVVVDGADRLEQEDWNRLARRGFHLHQWFTGSERCGWNPRHVAVHGRIGLKAIVPAYLTGADTFHDLHHRWLGPLGDMATYAGIRLHPVVSVQVPFAHVSEPLGNLRGLSSAILHEIFYALEQTAERERAKAVVWPFVDTGHDRLLDVANDRGYALLYADATAMMRVRWSSFEDYVASRSKSVRRTIRADLAAIHAAGIRTAQVSEFESDAGHMDRLFREAFRRRSGRDAPVAPHLFRQLSRRPTPSIRAQLTWHGDRLVGTSLSLATAELLDGTFAGFAAEHRNGPVYFNDLCYEPIRAATREGITRIDLGANSLYPKVLRGAVLQRRMVLIRGTTPTRHKWLRMLGQLVARRTQYRERKSLGLLWGPRCFNENIEPRLAGD